MVKRIATSTVLLLALTSAGIAAGQAPEHTTGGQNVDRLYKKPIHKPPKTVRSVPEPGGLLLFGAVLVAGVGALKRKA